MRELLPDTGIPSTIGFLITFDGKSIEGTITVTDGSAAPVEALNSVWPSICEKCPALQQADSFTMTVYRQK